MSYKSENWKEKLEQVRNHIALKEGSVEKTADEILESQIEEELNTFDDIQEVTDKEIKGVKQLSKLKIYIGENHPHTAQNPEIIEIKNLNNKNIIRN